MCLKCAVWLFLLITAYLPHIYLRLNYLRLLTSLLTAIFIILSTWLYNKTGALVLFLGFLYFELRNIYKAISNLCKNSNQYTVVDSFVDIGAGLVLSMWFVIAILYLTLKTSGL